MFFRVQLHFVEVLVLGGLAPAGGDNERAFGQEQLAYLAGGVEQAAGIPTQVEHEGTQALAFHFLDFLA